MNKKGVGYFYLLVSVLFTSNSWAIGEFDTSFGGGDGKVTLDFGNHEAVHTIVCAPSPNLDHILTHVESRMDDAAPEGGNEYLKFFSSSGSLDEIFSFGEPILPDVGQWHVLTSALQADGSVLFPYKGAGGDMTCLTRVSGAGVLDATFASGSCARVDVSPSEVFIQPADRKILVCGSDRLRRFLPEGEADASYGRADTDGSVGWVFPRDDYDMRGRRECAMQSDGRIIALGISRSIDTPEIENQRFLLLRRFNDDGSVDSLFGEGGVVEIDPWPLYVGTIEEQRAAGYEIDLYSEDTDTGGERRTQFYEPLEGIGLKLQPDGKIIVKTMGEAADLLFRYDQLGRLDRSFSGDGVAWLREDHGPYNEMAVQLNGKIVLVSDGSVISPSTPRPAPAAKVMRLTADGVPDRNFSPDGSISMPDGINLYSVALQPDGKILVGGRETLDDGSDHLFLARLIGDPVNTDLSVSLPRDARSLTLNRRGQSVVLRATLNNSGPAEAAYTRVIFEFSTDLDLDARSIRVSQGSCAPPESGRLTCAIGRISMRRSATVDFTVQPRIEGTFRVTATVSTSMNDVEIRNNTAYSEIRLRERR